MRWVVVTRHGGILTVLAVLLGAVAGAAGNVDIGVPIPGLSGSAPTMPLTVLPALALVLAIQAGTWDGEVCWMGASVRSVVGASAMVASGVMAVSLVVCLIVSWAEKDPWRGVLYARDLLSLGLLCWVGGRLFRPGVGAALPAFFLLLCLLFARQSTGELRWWAWLVDRDPWHPVAWTVVVLAAACAVLVPALRRPMLR